jgi:long-chain acyl-CoA synthetase
MNNDLNTINKRFADAASKYPTLPALSSKAAKDGGGKDWQTLTYQDVQDRMRHFSLGLRSLGVERGDRVAMLSENRPEWAIADLAALASGGVTVPIYSTLPPAQVAHILNDSGATAIIVSDAKQLEKVLQARDTCPALRIFVTMDEASAKGDVLSFEGVLQEGKSAEAAMSETFEARRDSVQPEDLMSLVYTSGTTGNPKGAMLTHRNFTAALDGAVKAFPFYPPHEVFLSFLPLCHVFERVTYCLSLTLGAHTYYNDSIFKLIDNMATLKPTIMQCVPRVFESIHERVLDTVAKEPEKKQKVFQWAIEVGKRAADRKNGGKPVFPILAIQHAVAEKLVLAKLRQKFGGHIKFFVSGGAPLNPKTADFFNAIGIPILEGWGLTETTAASTVNPYGRSRVGTVGRAGFGAEVKTAEDGELLIRGPHVMRGYWNNPEATAEVIDSDGWFHSGDIGVIDRDGYIKITDRKKDILVLANGKKVAPQPIETRLKESPYISEVVLLGDRAGTVGALVVPAFDRLKTWAKEQGIATTDAASLAREGEVKKLIKKEIDRLSGDLADFEKIKRLAVIDHAFTVDAGELTPTLKIRRKVISDNYGALLD